MRNLPNYIRYKSDSQDNFECQLQKLKDQAAAKSLQEPDVIERVENEVDSDGFAKSDSQDNFESQLLLLNTQATAKSLEGPVGIKPGETGAGSGGFSMSDSQHNFEAAVQILNTQAAGKSLEEPVGIEPGETGADSDGFSKSTDSADFDRRAVSASQAVVVGKAVLEKGKEVILKNADGKKNRLTKKNVDGCQGTDSGLASVVGDVGVGKSHSFMEEVKASTKSVKKNVEMGDGKKMKEFEEKKMSGAGGVESRKKKRRLPDVYSDDEIEMVPSHEAVQILFGEGREEEMDSCEVVGGNLPGIVGENDCVSDGEFDAVGLVQSSQKISEGGGEVENLSQEIKDKVNVKSAQQDQADDNLVKRRKVSNLKNVKASKSAFEESCGSKMKLGNQERSALGLVPDEVPSKTNSKLKTQRGRTMNRAQTRSRTKACLGIGGSSSLAVVEDEVPSKANSKLKTQPVQRMNRVRVAPVQFFGTQRDKPDFGYLESCAGFEDDDDCDAVFMFGEGQNYRMEYNVILSDDEFADQDILTPQEKDARESDDEDNSLDQMELDQPGPSVPKRQKKKNRRENLDRHVDVSSTQWGPTQEFVSQSGTTRAIKLGVKKKQSIGKQGKFATDQKHSVNL